MGKKSSPAPQPDPQIGQAALKEAQLGEDWLKFAKDQFAAGNLRQEEMDALTEKVINSQLASQDQANKWASEDRATKAKYDAWAVEDRAYGKEAGDALQAYGSETLANAKLYEQGFNDRADKQFAFADEQQGRYKSTFVPIEDRIAKDAMEWDSDARMASEAAKAKADVVGNAAAQAEAERRQMASMGVNPNSGRFAGVSRATGLNTALAAAGAQNMARDVVRQQGLALRGQASQLGQQVNANANAATGIGMQAKGAAHSARLAGENQALTATNMRLAARGIGNTAAQTGIGSGAGGYQGLGLGLNAGNAAVGNQGAANQNFYANTGIMGQGFGGAMQGYGKQADILNNVYGTQVSAWAAQQQANATSAAGLGSMLGTGIGAYAAL